MKIRERSLTVDARPGSPIALAVILPAFLSALRASYLYSNFYFFFYSYRRSFAVRPGEASV
jgi:hypothetical protein